METKYVVVLMKRMCLFKKKNTPHNGEKYFQFNEIICLRKMLETECGKDKLNYIVCSGEAG